MRDEAISDEDESPTGTVGDEESLKEDESPTGTELGDDGANDEMEKLVGKSP